METEIKPNNSVSGKIDPEKRNKSQYSSYAKKAAIGVGGMVVGSLISGSTPMPDDEAISIEEMDITDQNQSAHALEDPIVQEKVEAEEETPEEVDELTEIQPVSHYNEEDVAEIYPIGGDFTDPSMVILEEGEGEGEPETEDPDSDATDDLECDDNCNTDECEDLEDEMYNIDD